MCIRDSYSDELVEQDVDVEELPALSVWRVAVNQTRDAATQTRISIEKTEDWWADATTQTAMPPVVSS
eukprot:2707542-Prorocentrum_lima.AAC.1